MSQPPTIPSWTCPDIDQAIKSAHETASAIDRSLSEVVRDVEHWAKGFEQEMETLRRSNEQLRDAVDYWKDRALEAEAQEAA